METSNTTTITGLEQACKILRDARIAASVADNRIGWDKCHHAAQHIERHLASLIADDDGGAE